MNCNGRDLASIGERLRRAREEQGMTQEELALRLGVKRPLIAYYESGQRDLKTATIATLAYELHISADYIVGLTRNPSPERELDTVYDYTRLSREALSMVHDAREDLLKELDVLLQNPNFWLLLSLLREYKEAKSALAVEGWLDECFSPSKGLAVTAEARDAQFKLWQAGEILNSIANGEGEPIEKKGKRHRS